MGPEIVGVIRSRRLGGLGHVQFRNGNTMIKKVCEGRPYRVRPLRRPRMDWNDQVRSNLRKLGVDLEMEEDGRARRHLFGESNKPTWFSMATGVSVCFS